MHDFAIIAEGITDQIVIRELLLAYFSDSEDEPTVNFVQPDLDRTARSGVHEPGGWTLVTRYLRDGRTLEALQTNRHVVIHIDTDIAADLGVPSDAKGDDATLEATIRILRDLLGDLAPEIEQRVLFAIGVDSIECWLLHRVFDRSQKRKRRKTTGCLQAVNHALRKGSAPLLEKGGKKIPEAYRQVAAGWRRRGDVEPENPGLARFMDQLDARFGQGADAPEASAPSAVEDPT